MTSAEVVALAVVAAVASTAAAFIGGVAYWRSSCRGDAPCCDLKMRSAPATAAPEVAERSAHVEEFAV